MRRFRKLFIILFFGLFLFISNMYAQFYNGHQMTFGKNRVQYNDFYWSYYRFDQFDTYFNQDGRELAEYVAGVAEDKIPEIEAFFDYSLDQRIIFLVYNKLSDFRQSNIGLISGKDEYNLGGVTNISKNKVFLFYEGEHEELDQQVSAGVAEVIINEMLYGNEFKDNLANSTLLNLPEWYIPGLISYVSNNWDYSIENKVKDGILSGKYEKFNRLTGEDAIMAGHSFWRYIAETYGASVIPNIVYLTRINKNSNSGFLFVLGLNLKELSYEWLGYYIDKYSQLAENQELPEEKPLLKKPRKKSVYKQINISPGGKYIAYVTNEMGQYKIWLYNLETDKKDRILKKSHKIDQITDYSYPVLAWHPSGRILTFITEEKGGLDLYYYLLDEEKLESRNFLYFDKVLDYSYADDGLKFVMSAVKNGKTDIFVHYLTSSTNEQITDDLADDFNPRFIQGSDKILFSSTRESDTLYKEAPIEEQLLNAGLSRNLFIYDFKKRSPVLKRLNTLEYTDNIQPYEVSRDRYVFLSDKNGIWNRRIAEYDSTISFIDTVTHYRYYTTTRPLTDYSRNIIEQSFARKSPYMAEVIYNDGRYYMYNRQADFDEQEDVEPTPTDFSKEYFTSIQRRDSLRKISKEIIPIQNISNNTLIIDTGDTLQLDKFSIDINNYIFEVEKINYYNNKFKDKNINFTMDSIVDDKPKIRIYETSFFTNYLVNQVDFSFLNASYQAFTGGAVYYNPGLNMLFKIGTNDLFEDYRLIGGVRFSGDFDSNEYLLSLEDLKKRVDKQYLFHRQAFKNTTDIGLVKTHTHELMYILKYPFDQVRALKGTMSIRHDRSVFLSTDDRTLESDNIHKLWGGVKLEYIFDNTRKLGINLLSGTRYKIFGEAYKQINEDRSDLYVLGADFRHYIRIHRELIWANRFAASTSFGKSRLIYYLGSVDNWTNLSPRVETFDRSVPINEREKYAYQTLATNMRGFAQNIRNGNNFALINSEIRWPVVRYFANHPISSNFWNNLQLVGFFDVGTAWAGLTPYSGKNAYDNDIIENNTIRIIVDANREPIVAGYGFGVRAMLLGYFIRLDWAWGIENNLILPNLFYFSLNLDF